MRSGLDVNNPDHRWLSRHLFALIQGSNGGHEQLEANDDASARPNRLPRCPLSDDKVTELQVPLNLFTRPSAGRLLLMRLYRALRHLRLPYS